MEIVLGVITSLIAATLIYLIGLITPRIHSYFSDKRPVMDVWGIKMDKEEFHIVVSNLTPEPNRKKPINEYDGSLTGVGELEAINFINESIHSAYSSSVTYDFAFSDEFPSTQSRSNIVSVGGPKYNEVTRFCLKDLELPISLLLEPPVQFVDRNLNKIYAATLNGRRFEKDWALIIKMPNPLDDNKNVFLFIGLHTLGTAGAARMLTKPYISQLTKEIRKFRMRYWEALIRVDIRGLQVFPKLEEFRNLDSSLFKRRTR